MLFRPRLDATTSGERSPPAPGARTAVGTGWRVLAAGANRGMATASTRVPPARMYFVMAPGRPRYWLAAERAAPTMFWV